MKYSNLSVSPWFKKDFVVDICDFFHNTNSYFTAVLSAYTGSRVVPGNLAIGGEAGKLD